MNILQISAAIILVAAPHISSAVCINQPTGLAICGQFCPPDIQKFGGFSDDFSACTYTQKTSPYPITLNLITPDSVDISGADPGEAGSLACPNWTLSPANNSWFFLVSGVTPPNPFTSVGDTAVWLNEGNPHTSMSRHITGLTIGNQYRIKYTFWADDGSGGSSGLDISVNPGLPTVNKPLLYKQSPTEEHVDFTATASVADLTLAEAAIGGSISPMISRVELACLTKDDPICSPCKGQRLRKIPT